MKKYVVQPGDSLYKISQKTGVRIPLLLASNPGIQNPSQLMPGMSIVIPELGKKAKGSATASVSPSQKSQSYKPKSQKQSPKMPPYFGFVWPHQASPSDTWSSIAKKYGVSVQQLHHVNPELAQQGSLVPGHTVYVPTPAYSLPPDAMQQIPNVSGSAMGQAMQPPQGAGHYGAQNMPVPPGAGSGQSPTQMPQMPQPSQQQAPQAASGQGELYGPNTHYPYRVPTPLQGTANPSMQSGNWFVADESSSFLSDTDDAMRRLSWQPDHRAKGQTEETSDNAGSSDFRTAKNVSSVNDTGWSETFTVRIDDER